MWTGFAEGTGLVSIENKVDGGLHGKEGGGGLEGPASTKPITLLALSLDRVIP